MFLNNVLCEDRSQHDDDEGRQAAQYADSQDRVHLMFDLATMESPNCQSSFSKNGGLNSLDRRGQDKLDLLF